MRHMLGNTSPNYFERTKRWLMMHPDGGWGSETLSLTAFAAPTLKTVTKKSKVTSCTVSFTPSQDLHGYSNPWPAGGGRNLCPMTATSGSGTNGLSITVNDDLTFYATKTGNAWGLITLGTATLKAGSYKIYEESDNNTNAALNVMVGDTNIANTRYVKNGLSFSLTEDTEISVTYSRASETTSPVLVKAMIYPATDTDTSYAPYSNLCPISGWQGATLTVDPKYGGDITWNQLVQNGDFASTSGWWVYSDSSGSISAENNVLTYTVSNGGSSGYQYGFQSYLGVSSVPNHKYIYIASARFSDDGVSAAFEYGGTEPSVSWIELPANTWTDVAYIFTQPNRIGSYLLIKPKGGVLTTGATMEYKNIMLLDLTLMFGAGNEPESVESFRALFPLDYYAYNAGEVTNVSAVSGLPYSKTSVTFGQTVYGGTAEIVAGTGSEAWTELTLNGTETWGGSGAHSMYTQVNSLAQMTDYSQKMLCEALKPYKNQNDQEFINAEYGITGYGFGDYPNQNWIYIAAAGINNTTDLKAWLAQNPVKVVFVKATPTPYTFPPASAELILQKGDNYNWATMTTGD